MSAIRCAVLAVVAVIAAGASAAAEWERTTLEIQAASDAHSVEGRFPLRNDGDRTLALDHVEAGCGCMAVHLEPDRIAPGASGAIVATFPLGSGGGRIVENMTVRLSDGAEQALRLVANVPKVFDVDRQVFRWAIGDAAESRRIRVTVVGEARLTRFEPQASAGFALAVEAVEAGRVYDVVATPLGTAQVQVEQIRIATDHPAATRSTVNLYTAVR